MLPPLPAAGLQGRSDGQPVILVGNAALLADAGVPLPDRITAQAEAGRVRARRSCVRR